MAYIIGHSLRFFKKASSINLPINNEFFNFITFGSFDGVRVHNAETLNDFSIDRICANCGLNHPENCDSCSADKNRCPSRHCAHCDRQILNLLKIKSENIFEDGEGRNENGIFSFSDYPEKPIIAVLILTSNSSENIVKICELEKILKDCGNNNDVAHESFNVLSSEDKVIIFRSKSVFDIFEMLKELKKVDGNNFVNFHTIFGIFKDNKTKAANWQESVNVYASIRIHIRPNNDFDSFVSKLETDIEGMFDFTPEFPLNLVQTNGKYDVAFRCPLTNPDKFLALFADGGILNPHEENPNAGIFISSNTKFCCKPDIGIDEGTFSELEGDPNGDDAETNLNNSKSPKFPWVELVGKAIKIDNKSKIIGRAAIVLAERVHLIKHSVFSQKNYELIYKFTENFLDKLVSSEMELNNPDTRMTILEHITSINLFIDNIYSYGYRDFENPQKDIRIATDSGKFLLLYTRFAQDIFDRENLDFKALIVPSINEIIEKYSSNQTNTFVANISESSIFDVYSNLMSIGHEVGHDFYAPETMFNSYRSIIIHRIASNFAKNTGCNIATHEALRKEFSQKSECVLSFFNDEHFECNNCESFSHCCNVIIDFAVEHGLDSDIDVSNLFTFEDTPEDISYKRLRFASDEVFADRFMMSEINLMNFDRYFEFLFGELIKGEMELTPDYMVRIIAIYLYCYNDRSAGFINAIKRTSKIVISKSKFVDFADKIQDWLTRFINKIVVTDEDTPNDELDKEHYYDLLLLYARIINKSIPDFEKKVRKRDEDDELAKQIEDISNYSLNTAPTEDESNQYLNAVNQILGFDDN